MKQVLKGALVTILCLAVFIGLLAALNVIDLKFYQYFGKEKANIQREIFEENKSHVHGMIEDLAKYKLELARTEDEVERKAIINYITENYATFDGDKIENDSLREFYYDVMEGSKE